MIKFLKNAFDIIRQKSKNYKNKKKDFYPVQN